MGYNRKNTLFDFGIVEVSNDQILQNEISLGRWIVDAIGLLLSIGEKYDLAKEIPIQQLGFSFIPDIYLPKGCDALDLQGSTIIEIKNNLLYDTEIRQSEIYRLLVDDGIVDNLLIVYINSNQFSLKGENRPGRIRFINALSFVTQAKEAINEGRGGVNAALRGEKQKPNISWEGIRNERLKIAINDFNRYDSVIFAGAGVSVSAKIPDWQSLLKNLLADSTIFTPDDFVNVFKSADYSNLVTARYIEKNLNTDKRTLIQKIKELLYPNNQHVESKLINIICKLIVHQTSLRSVITYNYDTLIEDNLKREGKPCFSVYKNNRDERNSFPVYHVHGVVFRNSAPGDQEDIVLTENDYHRVYSEVFDWSNVEQLHALTRCTCFFIGLSLNDPNLRRLLEISQRDSSKSVRHYVFLERKSAYDEIEKAEKDFQTREDILADLGLNVIWYKGNDKHRELPKLLKLFITH
ncbi:MAG: SIR2 family protein [Bacteroidales bacterium]|nr:SIR2 family protein [Bacteroidales bacterium]